MVTADGRAAPGAFGRNTTIKGGVNAAQGHVRKAPKKTQRFDNGERSRYYADDDKSLQDLVAEQKYSGTEDYDRNLADNIARHKRYRGKELDVDDEYDHDGGLEMYENREKKMSGAKQQAQSLAVLRQPLQRRECTRAQQRAEGRRRRRLGKQRQVPLQPADRRSAGRAAADDARVKGREEASQNGRR